MLEETNFFVNVICGCAGGVLVEALALYKIRRQSLTVRPEYYRYFFYYFSTVLMILAGGFLVFVYIASEISITPILALNIGASAPLTIAAFANSSPNVAPGSDDDIAESLLPRSLPDPIE